MCYYDLFLPIGDTCRPAYHLKMNDLRSQAYPLDWQKGYSLETVIHLFKTGFEDFFDDIVEEEDGLERDCRRVRDVKNNIISLHDFLWNAEIEKAQKQLQLSAKKNLHI